MDASLLWREYTVNKQTYAQLAEKYACSPRTIKRRLDSYTPPRSHDAPRRVIVVMDTTYWGRGNGVMLFKDALTQSDLLWYFVRNESNALYAQGIDELERMGYRVEAIVCDGRRGLPEMFPGKKVQLCQFHQLKTVRRYLTKSPKSEAAVELKKIADMLARTDRESFEGLFGQWCVRWERYLKERAIDPLTGRSHYAHKRLRSAYLSLRRNLPLLFTWYEHLGMGIPNTTNLIDGHFSELKRMLRSHNGLSRERRDKLVVGFFEASRGNTR